MFVVLVGNKYLQLPRGNKTCWLGQLNALPTTDDFQRIQLADNNNNSKLNTPNEAPLLGRRQLNLTKKTYRQKVHETLSAEIYLTETQRKRSKQYI